MRKAPRGFTGRVGFHCLVRQEEQRIGYVVMIRYEC